MQSSHEQLLTARQTAERLGVKRDTLYAYVSRGMLHSVAVPGSKQRHYPADEVERFRAGRGADRAREAMTPVIDSAVSLIAGGHFYYRGRDAVRLAERAILEEVAALLWDAPTLPSTAPGGGQSEVRAAGLVERCQVRLATLAAEDLAALDLSRAGVARTGWRIVAALAACLGAAGGEGAPIHRRLAAHWKLDDAGADLVRRCLVLLADHELNASTFVARCVASTGATPYAVVTGALSALSGRRHGGASARAEALLSEIGLGAASDGDPLAVMAARLARGETLPGIGQPLYPDGDPRARAILDAAAAALPAARPRLAAAERAARQLTGAHPNVDFALAAAANALGLPAGAALGLFVVGRSVGWIAHAIEQYESGFLIRPRARYTGPPPHQENRA